MRPAQRRLRARRQKPRVEVERLAPAGEGLPRIEVRRARPGFHHPATPRQIRIALRAAGALSLEGIEQIELRPGGRGSRASALEFPGRIVLFDQPRSPWRVAGVGAQARSRFEAAGAEVCERWGLLEVRWSERALREFMLYEVLMREVARHVVLRQRGGEGLSDPEPFAASFARRVRESARVARLGG